MKTIWMARRKKMLNILDVRVCNRGESDKLETAECRKIKKFEFPKVLDIY